MCIIDAVLAVTISMFSCRTDKKFCRYCYLSLLDLLQLIFDDQVERLREKEVKEAKKRQRLGENFSDLLYSIKV